MIKTKLDKFKKKYEKKQNVIICDSLPSIEYWFLIHYLDTNKHYSTSESVIKDLRKHIKCFDKKGSFLSNSDWVKKMVDDGKIELACQRAKFYEDKGGSYSKIYKAIELLKKQ